MVLNAIAAGSSQPKNVEKKMQLLLVVLSQRMWKRKTATTTTFSYIVDLSWRLLWNDNMAGSRKEIVGASSSRRTGQA